MGKPTNKILLGLYWASLGLAAVGFCVVLGGLAALQHTANTRYHDPRQDPVYISVFTQARAIPYPSNPSWQFGFQWWLFAFEVITGLMCIAAGFRQRTLYRAKGLLLTFLAVCQVFMWITLEQLLFLSRNNVAKATFGKTKIIVNLVGVFIVAIANGFTTIFLGLIEDPYTYVRVRNNDVETPPVGTPTQAKVLPA